LAKKWVNGSHTACSGCVAGTDITSLWAKAPQGHFSPGFMRIFPVVGTFAASASPPVVSAPPPITVDPAPAASNADQPTSNQQGTPLPGAAGTLADQHDSNTVPEEAETTDDGVEQPESESNSPDRDILAAIGGLAIFLIVACFTYYVIKKRQK
jgi:hypothetical protein